MFSDLLETERHMLIRGEWCDALVYGILREEWAALVERADGRLSDFRLMGTGAILGVYGNPP